MNPCEFLKVLHTNEQHVFKIKLKGSRRVDVDEAECKFTIGSTILQEIRNFKGHILSSDMKEDGRVHSFVVLKENLIDIVAIFVFKSSHSLVDFTLYHVEFYLETSLVIC
jgi:hypothetical protein